MAHSGTSLTYEIEAPGAIEGKARRQGALRVIKAMVGVADMTSEAPLMGGMTRRVVATHHAPRPSNPLVVGSLLVVGRIGASG